MHIVHLYICNLFLSYGCLSLPFFSLLKGIDIRIFYVSAPVYEVLFIFTYGIKTVTNILFVIMANTGIQYAEYQNSVFTHISYYGIPEIDESRYSLAYTNTGIR